MNLLELKSFTNRKLRVEFYYDFTRDFEPGIFCKIDKKYDIKDFLKYLDELKIRLFEDILNLESVQITKRTLLEYEMLSEEFNLYTLNGHEFLIFKNFQIFVDEKYLKYDVDYNAPLNERTWTTEPTFEIITDYEDKIHNDFIEIHEITKVKIARDVDRLSRQIFETVEKIIGFINLHFNAEFASGEVKKTDADRLSVKQQVLILHYLFNFFHNSKTEIPNNKLSQLLGKVLGRNSETVRGLLTLMSRVEDNESDDKIAKTPKNLNAVYDLFNALKLQPLQQLVERDIEKTKKKE